MFKTEAEPGLNGRALAYPRGKVIGGCSAINAMLGVASINFKQNEQRLAIIDTPLQG